jgi:hypothetical protein
MDKKINYHTNNNSPIIDNSSTINTNKKSDPKPKINISSEINDFLSELTNKYSGNANQKDLNELYDIGLYVANVNYNKDKMIDKIDKIVEKKAKSEIKVISENKKKELLEAFKNGIRDGSSNEYRLAYNKSNKYQYNKKKLSIRGRINGVLNFHDKKTI